MPKGIPKIAKPDDLKGGRSSHMYDRVMYLKNTADEFNANHRDFLKQLRADKFICPMGWMRAQLAPGSLSQLVTEEKAHEGAF